MDTAKPSSVLLIYTGGTIGMVQDPQNGRLKPFDFSRLLEEVPELRKFETKIETHAFSKPIDSSDMHPANWIELAKLVEERYNDYDGFVVLHGSDTMAFTASALSFMFENIAKPVVFTGSQLPIGTIRTDGKENLITAIEIAAAKKNGHPVVPEVCIYFEYSLYRGNRTCKYSAEQFRAFQSPNYPLLAEAGVHLNFNSSAIAPLPNASFSAFTSLNENIAVLTLFPGIQKTVVDALLAVKNIRAVVLRTFGSGNGPTDKWFLDAITAAVQRGIIILNVTQCAAGKVEQGRYETSAGLAKAGVIGGGDMTLEAAVTKLMFLLGRESDPQKIAALLQQNLRGELTL